MVEKTVVIKPSVKLLKRGAVEYRLGLQRVPVMVGMSEHSGMSEWVWVWLRGCGQVEWTNGVTEQNLSSLWSGAR